MESMLNHNIGVLFPTIIAINSAAALPAIGFSLQAFADFAGVQREAALRVYVANLCYLGSNAAGVGLDLCRVIGDAIAGAPATSCAVIILPNVSSSIINVCVAQCLQSLQTLIRHAQHAQTHESSSSHQTRTFTQVFKLSSDTHKHTHTHTHTHHAQNTHRHTQTQTLMHTRRHTHTHSPTLTPTPTHPPTPAHTHMHTHLRTHTLTDILTPCTLHKKPIVQMRCTL